MYSRSVELTLQILSVAVAKKKMKYIYLTPILWIFGLMAASAEHAYDPMPLFTKILQNSINGGNPDALVKIDGLTKSKGSKSAPNHLSLAKDDMFLKQGEIPKYKKVTFWAKEEQGKILEFHLGMHDRSDLFESTQAQIEKSLEIKFEKTDWKKDEFGVSKEMKVVKNNNLILLKMSDQTLGSRQMTSLTLHIKKAE